MIATSPLTGRIFSGRVNKAGTAFVSGKQDVTSEVLRAVIEKADYHGGAFEIEGGGDKWTVTVLKATPTPVQAASVVPSVQEQLLRKMDNLINSAESALENDDKARVRGCFLDMRYHLGKTFAATPPTVVSSEGPTSKQEWWAGARVGLGVDPDMPRPEVAKLLGDKRKTPPAVVPVATVWFDKMPESNGKTNWTVQLCRKGGELFDGPCQFRGENYEIARYHADWLRYYIGESDERPNVLDYNPDAPAALTQHEGGGA